MNITARINDEWHIDKGFDKIAAKFFMLCLNYFLVCQHGQQEFYEFL